MPEHRPGTPEEYYVLESFLWRDFENMDGWLDWTREHGLARAATSTREIFELAMALRSALRLLESANNGARANASAAGVLDALIQSLGVHPQVDRFGEVTLRAGAATARNAPIASMLVMALDAMSSGEWKRFKLCRDPNCAESFYDSSRNATKVWCSMDGCGSRNKMRRMRRRAGA